MDVQRRKINKKNTHTTWIKEENQHTHSTNITKCINGVKKRRSHRNK